MGREALAALDAAAPAPSAEPSDALRLTVALPAARALMGEPIADDALVRCIGALASGPARVVTLTGQHRPVYRPLAIHLALRALAVRRDALDAAALRDARAHVAALTRTLAGNDARREDVALGLWSALCRFESGALLEDREGRDEALAHVDALLATMPAEGALHARSMDDQLDQWTYRELSGLHALVNLAWGASRSGWWEAAHRVAGFHLEHTQPDYTTYEPWAVHAFLCWPTMTVFADQQLHDVQAHRHVSEPAAALLPALLLADAAAMLADPACRRPG